MAAVLVHPAYDLFNHPAYRRLILTSSNMHAPAAERYGAELELTINAILYKLMSRKRIYSHPLVDMFEFDMASLLQELVTYDLHAWGLKKDQIDSNSCVFVEGNLFDWNAIAGVATKDLLTSVAIEPFMVHNTCLQHVEYILFGSGYYHTMHRFSPLDNPTGFQFLTHKADGSKVCLGDSEYLPVLIDDVLFNAVRIQFYNSSGTVVGAGYYYLQAFTLSGASDIKNPRRSVGVGPDNINGTVYDITFGVVGITAATAKYDVSFGFMDHLSLTFLFQRTRTYLVEGNCCASRTLIYFLNTRGGIDVIDFNEVSESSAAVKSTNWEQSTTLPFDIEVGGDQRLGASSKASYTFNRFFERDELPFMHDFVNSVLCWIWQSKYVPIKIQDDTFKVVPSEDGALVEFKIDFSNDYSSQRN